jgi:hypothetical protein
VIRKSLLVAVIILCVVAALLLSAGRTGKPAYLGYWRAADETLAGGPLLIRVAGSGDSITVAGLPAAGAGYTVAEKTPSKLTLEAPGESQGSYVNILFDAGDDYMKVTVVPVEDAGTAGVPLSSLDFVRARESDERLAAELAAEVVQQSRPPEQIVADNAHILARAIEAWAADHDGQFPPPQMVGVGSELTKYIDGQWPTNPMTKSPMQWSGTAGDFSYATDGKTYKLVVNMPDGSTLTLP